MASERIHVYRVELRKEITTPHGFGYSDWTPEGRDQGTKEWETAEDAQPLADAYRIPSRVVRVLGEPGQLVYTLRGSAFGRAAFRIGADGITKEPPPPPGPRTWAESVGVAPAG